jgi:hypothetical protein
MNVVYTVITGGRNELIEEQETKGAKFLAFTDTDVKSKTWDILPAYDRFKDDRRNSRIQKFMPDKFFDADYSLYIDGNIQLKVPVKKLIDEFLDGFDVAIFKHHARTCIYDEGAVVQRLNFDDPAVVAHHLKRYEKLGYPKQYGLTENGFILRRHTQKVREWGEAWFAEHAIGSKRDQLSGMYAAWRIGLPINRIMGPNGENVYQHPYLEMRNHTGGSR